jgi:hypothetical protein
MARLSVSIRTASLSSGSCCSTVPSRCSTLSISSGTSTQKSDDEGENLRFRNGEDTQYLPLCDRKLRLRAAVPKSCERLLYCDHIDEDGERLSSLACENDLEGIVAKRRGDPDLSEHATWLKIRNQNYSEWTGREELFERERAVEPNSNCGIPALWPQWQRGVRKPRHALPRTPIRYDDSLSQGANRARIDSFSWGVALQTESVCNSRVCEERSAQVTAAGTALYERDSSNTKVTST